MRFAGVHDWCRGEVPAVSGLDAAKKQERPVHPVTVALV